MQRALRYFQKEGVDVEPDVEDLLQKHNPAWIQMICQYYASPKGGTQYDVEKMETLLSQNKSVAHLAENK